MDMASTTLSPPPWSDFASTPSTLATQAFMTQLTHALRDMQEICLDAQRRDEESGEDKGSCMSENVPEGNKVSSHGVGGGEQSNVLQSAHQSKQANLYARL
ncbi:hypothetical protein SCLCIDRAFT_1106608 [Scleroderma citrinum Foug A]|uniref:Uncharacterized protein n=1 Tax=Scleroderma citrinum Foug A TaxID=1036808 RepID=A0A0C3E3Y1_9AGAM|nr:hypothetical protein SCLCIDRAFT_1106608 [Scleroderma citrinum Foug A]